MIAAAIQYRDGTGEDAWLGVSLNHIRLDAERHGCYFMATLREVSLSAVTGMENYVHAVEVLQRIEWQYRGLGREVPFIAGTSTYFLGRLPQRVSQPA